MDDDDSGPVVRTAGPSYARNRDYSDYQDNIALIDLSAMLRKFGIRRSSYGMKAWFVKDVCGIICAVITWGLILYAEYVIMVVMLLPSPSKYHSLINGVIFQFFAFLAVVSHLKAMLTDPGAVPRGNATKEYIMKLGLKDGQVVYKCPKCISIKPERAHHCSVCKRCIKKMDHHCPWVNNCVGENNQKYFVLFTLYICLISCHAMYLAIHHFVTCIRHDWKTCTYLSPAATTVFMIFLLFEALLFGIFTAIMCGTQIGAICNDETGIEQLKNEAGHWEKKSRWLSLEAVFGHPFSYRWFSPFHSANISGCKHDIYLYTV